MFFPRRLRICLDSLASFSLSEVFFACFIQGSVYHLHSHASSAYSDMSSSLPYGRFPCGGSLTLENPSSSFFRRLLWCHAAWPSDGRPTLSNRAFLCGGSML